ncbi:hypothetical protein DF107_05760 [Burkholderia stagnalis]|uniref:hypothetical protein n=1 Tax=Burkholderia stagnalis TaxID=1503054 RepID=UPI000F5B448A|nr:hypothetical protein [Burkholderia stagnalis]RQQ20790.1 hypothetical protein DF161_03725 [Burkholderia stagnalis]RQY84420.1 hypothetical protein DF107_05760 [Burkholderia stagnalis]
MIKRPEQIRLLALGLPDVPANRSDSNSSESKTENNYADRRNAVQGGAAISGDNNTMLTSITTTDQGAVQAGTQIAQSALGVANYASAANMAVAHDAIWNSTQAASDVTAASSHLADVGLAMLQTNTALANSLEGGVNQATQAVTGIASQLAQTQVAAQNDNRYLIAAGMAVVAIVGFAAFGKGKA